MIRPAAAPRSLFLFGLSLAAMFTCTSPQSAGSPEGALWHEKLPACPCENPDLKGLKTNDGWAEDKGNIQKYHKGAAHCFRSYPYVRTQAGKSGQQCCYDAQGKLITDGSGAGSPDKVSTCKGEKSDGSMRVRYAGLWGHYFRDVKPWNKFGGEKGGWKEYNKLWKPNKGEGCAENKAPKE